MAKIATRISQLTGEGALAVYTRAKELEKQGRSIIHLELGEPDFHPAAPVVDALRAAVAEGRDRYVSTRGIPALREGIAKYLKHTRKLDVRAEQVLVAPGCKMALSLAMMALPRAVRSPATTQLLLPWRASRVSRSKAAALRIRSDGMSRLRYRGSTSAGWNLTTARNAL